MLGERGPSGVDASNLLNSIVGLNFTCTPRTLFCCLGVLSTRERTACSNEFYTFDLVGSTRPIYIFTHPLFYCTLCVDYIGIIYFGVFSDLAESLPETK